MGFSLTCPTLSCRRWSSGESASGGFLFRLPRSEDMVSGPFLLKSPGCAYTVSEAFLFILPDCADTVSNALLFIPPGCVDIASEALLFTLPDCAGVVSEAFLFRTLCCTVSLLYWSTSPQAAPSSTSAAPVSPPSTFPWPCSRICVCAGVSVTVGTEVLWPVLPCDDGVFSGLCWLHSHHCMIWFYCWFHLCHHTHCL